MHKITRQSVIIVSSLFLAFTLMAPIIACLFMGLTMTAPFEEGLAYSYFYTLRMLFSQERPWVPNGHAVGLIWEVVNYFLYLIGFPVNQVFPRIDIFYYIITPIPGIISGFSFYWAVQPLRSRLGILCILFVAIFISYNSRVYEIPMAWPSYVPWSLPFSLIALGFLIRAVDPNTQTVFDLKWGTTLGMFAGLCLSTKMSYGVMPFAVGCAAIAIRPRWQTIISLAWAALVSLIGFAAFIWAYNLGSFSALAEFFDSELYWLRTMSNTLGPNKPSLLDLLTAWLPETPLDAIFFGVWLPPILMLAAILSGRVQACFAMLLPWFLALMILGNRFYFITIIEFLATTMVINVGVIYYAVNWPQPLTAPLQTTLRNAGGVTLVILIFAFVKDLSSRTYHQIFYDYAIRSNAARAMWDDVQSDPEIPTVMLTNDNSYHPFFVGSTLCKGGTDIYNPVWGASPFMEKTFPKIWCYMYYDKPIEPRHQGKLLFVYSTALHETQTQAFERIKKHFSNILMEDYNCHLYDAVGASHLICRIKSD